MSNVVGKIVALAAGALAMYYLDPEQGARRRAAFVSLVSSGVNGPSPRGSAPRRRRSLRAYHVTPKADPQSDAQLRDRIRERLDRLVSHPGALEVKVENGVVRLSGNVLARERDGLLLQVQQMPGVQKLVNAMASHESPDGITGNASGSTPAAASA